jgi:mono/diheme cytochrome c family protein
MMSSNFSRPLSKVLIGGISFVCFALLGFPAESQDTTSENPGFLASKGRVSYQRYCANCHGERADGRGPVAQFLTVKVPDLRLIAVENSGEYPAEEVTSFIDGRSQVALHGNREMPIWGEIFQSDMVSTNTNETDEERAQRKVRELVHYLESIQLVAPPKAATEGTVNPP